MTDKTREAFEAWLNAPNDSWKDDQLTVGYIQMEAWKAATADADAEIRRWKARCIAAENGHPQVKEATSAADAKYLPVIEKLVEYLEFIQMLGIEPNDLTDTVRIGRAENAARKALALAATLLAEKRGV